MSPIISDFDGAITVDLMTNAHEITELLQAWRNGDTKALDKLMPLIDHELRKLAHFYMSRERARHILQTTALVNEALMRLIASDQIDWHSRAQFYSIVARRMRQVLIEQARAQLALKRGERPDAVSISAASELSIEKSQELVLLDEALTKLAGFDERKSKVIEYRFFGGFTVEEVANILHVSTSTVESEWRLARSWLRREMISEAAPS